MHSQAVWAALVSGVVMLGEFALLGPAPRGTRADACAVQRELRYDEQASKALRTGTGEHTISTLQKHHATIAIRREGPSRVSFAYLTRARTDGTAPAPGVLGSIADYEWNEAKCTIGKLLHRRNQAGEITDDELQFRFDDLLISLPPRSGGSGFSWVDATERSDSLLQGGTRYMRKVRRMEVTGDTSLGQKIVRRVRVVTTDSIERLQQAGATPVRMVIVAHGEGTALIRVADNTMLERTHSQTDRYAMTSFGGINPTTAPALVQREWHVQLVP